MNGFYNQAYTAFMQKKQACDVANSEEEQTKAICDEDKAQIETSWCSLSAARKQSCTDLSDCIAQKGRAFDSIMDVTKLIEENTKKHVDTYIAECIKTNDCTSGAINP